jgi:hypothetical protein
LISLIPELPSVGGGLVVVGGVAAFGSRLGVAFGGGLVAMGGGGVGSVAGTGEGVAVTGPATGGGGVGAVGIGVGVGGFTAGATVVAGVGSVVVPCIVAIDTATTTHVTITSAASTHFHVPRDGATVEVGAMLSIGPGSRAVDTSSPGVATGVWCGVARARRGARP